MQSIYFDLLRSSSYASTYFQDAAAFAASHALVALPYFDQLYWPLPLLSSTPIAQRLTTKALHLRRHSIASDAVAGQRQRVVQNEQWGYSQYKGINCIWKALSPLLQYNPKKLFEGLSPENVGFMATSDCPIGRWQSVAMLALVFLLLGPCLLGNLKQIITLELILFGTRSRRLCGQSMSLQLFFGVARAIISECCTLALHPISLGKQSHPQPF